MPKSEAKVVVPFSVFREKGNTILDVVETSKESFTLNRLLSVKKIVKVERYSKDDVLIFDNSNKVHTIALGEKFIKITGEIDV